MKRLRSRFWFLFGLSLLAALMLRGEQVRAGFWSTRDAEATEKVQKGTEAAPPAPDRNAVGGLRADRSAFSVAGVSSGAGPRAIGAPPRAAAAGGTGRFPAALTAGAPASTGGRAPVCNAPARVLPTPWADPPDNSPRTAAIAKAGGQASRACAPPKAEAQVSSGFPPGE